LLEEWKLEKFCEQYVNHSLGGRYWSGLWLLMVARTASTFYYLLSGNMGGIGKMFASELGRIEKYNGANFYLYRIARCVHRGGGSAVVFDFY